MSKDSGIATVAIYLGLVASVIAIVAFFSGKTKLSEFIGEQASTSIKVPQGNGTFQLNGHYGWYTFSIGMELKSILTMDPGLRYARGGATHKHISDPDGSYWLCSSNGKATGFFSGSEKGAVVYGVRPGSPASDFRRIGKVLERQIPSMKLYDIEECWLTKKPGVNIIGYIGRGQILALEVQKEGTPTFHPIPFKRLAAAEP